MSVRTALSLERAERESAERRLRQCWFEVEMAECQAQPAAVLAARYDQYVRALSMYIRAFEQGAEQLAS